MPAIKACPSCGVHIPPAAKFCMECGQRIYLPEDIKKKELPIQKSDSTLFTKPKKEKVIDQYHDDIPWEEEEQQVTRQTQPMGNEGQGGADNILTCNSCGKALKKVSKFCGSCGVVVVEKATAEKNPLPAATPDRIISIPVSVYTPMCDSCGSPLKKGTKFCGKCGAGLPVKNDTKIDIQKSSGTASPAPVQWDVVIGDLPAQYAKGVTEQMTTAVRDRVVRQADNIVKETVAIDAQPYSAHFCQSCGKPSKLGKKFCGSCGHKLLLEESLDEKHTQIL